MAALGLFLFPWDFLRLFWIFTPFDIFSFFYVLSLYLKNSILKKHFYCAAICFCTFSFFILVNGMFNPHYAIENLILVVGTLLCITKGISLYDMVYGSRDIDVPLFICLGFLFLNLCLLAVYFSGYGLSGSGRFYGFFPQSNGLAAYAVFSLSACLYCTRYGSLMLGFLGVVSSFMLILMSGSRGGLLTLMLCMFSWFALRNKKLSFFFIAISIFLICLSVFIDIPIIEMSLSVLEGILSIIPFPGVERLLDFLVLAKDIGFDQRLDSTRSSLNVNVLIEFLRNPVFLGNGYESSFGIADSYNRVHNIILIFLYELGIPLLFLLICFFLMLIVFFVKNISNNNINSMVSLWALVFFLQAMKTPYYLLNGVSWFLLFVMLMTYKNEMNKLIKISFYGMALHLCKLCDFSNDKRTVRFQL